MLCAAWPYSARAWHAVRRSPSRVPKIHDHTPTLNQVKFKRRNECVVEHVNVARQREILTVCYLSIRYSLVCSAKSPVPPFLSLVLIDHATWCL